MAEVLFTLGAAVFLALLVIALVRVAFPGRKGE